MPVYLYSQTDIFCSNFKKLKDERMSKMEKEIKRFKKYGTLKLIKTDEKRKDSKKT